MAFRRKARTLREQPAEAAHTPTEPTADPTAAAAKQSPWRMAMLLTSSALLSGIAVVLWNRRTLERMREAEAPPAQPPPGEFI